MLWHLGALLSQRDCPSQGYLIPRDGQQLTQPTVDFHMQTNQSQAHTPSDLLRQVPILHGTICLS